MTEDASKRDAAGVLWIGHKFPDYVRGPVTRSGLALFAGASNDHAPMHIDSDFAKRAGMSDVFAHGMLSMAWLGQALRHWTQPNGILNWGVRFTAITPLHASVICFGEVVEVFEDQNRRCARLSIGARTGEGVQTLAGEAIVAVT
jgi:acyl dehydratase